MTETPEMTAVPKVSVIIATYNYSTVLRYAMMSVLDQTYRDFELIVVGDCCTDDSEEVARSFGDPRVRWLNLPVNSGSKSIPQNAGIGMARGQWIAYIAHDDLWHPEHLETVVRTIESNGADLVYSVAVYVPPPGGTQRFVSGVFPEGEMRPGHALVHSSVIHGKTLTNELGGWPDHRTMQMPGDHVFFTRALEAGKRFVGVPRLTVWKFNASSRPGCYQDKRCDEQARYFDWLRNDPGLVEREWIDVARSAMQHGLVPLETIKPGTDAPAGSYVHFLRQVRGLEPVEVMEPVDVEENVQACTVQMTGEPVITLRCRERFQREVRIENHTNRLWASHQPHPINFSYHWFNEDDSMAIFDGERTALIPPLEAFRARHYFVTFVAPSKPGRYRLHPSVVQEGVRWFEDAHGQKLPLVEVKA